MIGTPLALLAEWLFVICYLLIANTNQLPLSQIKIYGRPVAFDSNWRTIMKIKFFILATVWVIWGVFVCGCIFIDGNSFRIETVSGPGTVISEERAVPTFNQISLKGPGKVILTKGENQNVQVNTDANIMPHIRTEVKDDRLVISHGKKNLRPTVLTFHITVANLKGVSISGSGLISGNDEFNSDSFYADIAGSGDIAINVAANNLESNISGSGSIYLSGSANSYDATITGSGDVDAFELQTRDSSVVITGSGNCQVNVSDQLQAKITGSGDVLYKGYPKINQTITGSGSVKDRN
jgi:hypothetical protein